MKTMHSLNSWLRLAAAVFLVVPALPLFAAKAPAVSAPITWHRRSAEGAELGLVPEITGPLTVKVGTAGKKNAKGGVDLHDVLGQAPQEFAGADTYYCALDPSLRGKAAFVEVRVSPAVVSDPNVGTVLNIDGAVVGFRKVVNGQAPPAIELVVREIGKDGRIFWARSGLAYAVNPRTQKPAPVSFLVKLDHKNQIWGLYSGNVAVDDFIALASVNASPTFSIRAGGGSTAVLEMVQVLDGPPKGNGRFKNDGNMDLAQLKGSISKNGEPIVHLPRKDPRKSK